MLVIKTYEDLYPYIYEYPWLKVKETEGILSVNYCNFTHAECDTELPVFPNAYALECRGIKFNVTTREVIARPFHKFFNLGEIEGDLVNKDITEALVVDKLDGSMVYPIIHPLSNKVCLCTKAGITEVSQLAEELTNPPLDVMREIMEEGYTPIFEFTSPHQQIVLRYKESSLTLLAVRHMISGEYVEDLRPFSNRLGIPIVNHYEGYIALDKIKEWKDKEGVVLVWNDGFRLKVKADEYVLRHKAKDGIQHEKNRIELVLGDRLDDFKSLVDEVTYAELMEYRSNLLSNISSFASNVYSLNQSVINKGLSKKDVALGIAPTLEPLVRCYLFQLYDKYSMGNDYTLEDFISSLHKDILSRTSSSSRLNTVRTLIGIDTFRGTYE